MIEILNNPWITGIGGGVVSGLIVYFVTERVLSKKQDKEYLQKVKTANNELLYTMRPLIVQKQIPSREVMESIIESTARKYELNRGDLFDVLLLADDLIREVMENAFLGSEQKIEFCTKISELKYKKVEAIENKLIFEKIVYQKDRLSSQYVSILFATTASMMVIFISLFTTMKGDMSLDGFDKLSSISSITLIGVIVPIMTMMMSLFLKRLKQYERDKNDEKDDKNKKEID